MENKIIAGYAGLNTDNILSQLKEGQLTFAKNAMVENFDGHEITYQNEQSNELCLKIKEGYKVVGLKNIVEQQKTILFLTHPITGDSEIGQKNDINCVYSTIIASKCLNFNIHYPIHQVVVKTTNCSTQLYWTDKRNPRRWIDLDDLPFREITDPNNEFRKIKIDGDVDCNKLLVQPNFDVPIIEPIRSETGGSLVEGAYQFAIQYANSLGEGYTSFYAFTNGVNIKADKVTPNFDNTTSNSININVTNLDTTGLFDYFNLLALETINGITTPKVVGTFAINQSTFNYTYTGNTKTNPIISIEEVFERFPYYDIAGGVTTTDNTLMWVDMATQQKTNYQSLWSNVRLNWITHKIPTTKFEGYRNPINNSQLRSYMRDEVYAFEGCFILRNGKITESYHIPGPMVRVGDNDIINNEDAFSTTENPCDPKVEKKRWQVYNTGSVIDFTQEFKDNGSSNCYKGSYQYGNFGYWESTINYPNNIDIWGNLAGKPIRHHKFPDCLISPIHDTDSIYPIGIQVIEESLYNALTQLSAEERAEIVGFKITRGNRYGNKSIVAKGLLYNVGEYTQEGQKYYYPNYPYNDLRPDPFIASARVANHSGRNENLRLDGFKEASKRRYTLLSPDTLFSQPTLEGGFIKLETVESGKTKSHFVKVKENAEYKFLTRDAIQISIAAAFASVINLEVGGGFGTQFFSANAGLNLSNVIPVFNATLDVLRNITPAQNYGWSFNSVGSYSLSLGIQNNGNKIRAIEYSQYLDDSIQSVTDDADLNNYRREGSVYIRTTEPLPFPHEQGGPIDNSRYLISDVCCADRDGCSTLPTTVQQRDISAYYASIKRVFNDQYGRMYSYETIDTGYYSLLLDTNGNRIPLDSIFGGDTFINQFALKRKHAFFIDNTVGKSEQSDINLDDLYNVGYPIFYYSTKPIDVNVDFSDLDDEIGDLTDFAFWTILGNLISGGTRPLRAGFAIFNKLFNTYRDVIGIPNTNFDCYRAKNITELGYSYLFAYGIPYFFVESEVNVDYRQATNDKEGDFYPHVSSDIPDEWVQEFNVPIINDNSYNYNISYSKQIKEISFAHLREDFDPDKLCLTEFPNRVIWSQKSSLEETKNNWLIYRPLSYHDFPKSYGKVTSIDGIEDRRVLTRFENKSQVYNAYATADVTTGTLLLGNPNFFSTNPLDFAETDTGYAGSQHKFLLKTEFGHVIVDAVRGQIFLYRGDQLQDISTSGMGKFFAENLYFKIKDTFKDARIDNHFNGIGLTGVHDSKYSRLIITKRDYIPIVPLIRYNPDTDIYTHNHVPIELTDPKYFCDVSWTLSYSLRTQSWISFHSYIPNFYIQHPGYFETGLNAVSAIYAHNFTLTFQRFYGKIEDYILEYPVSFLPNEEILSSFSDYTSIIRYESHDVYYEVEEGGYFNQAVVYNNSQCSGILNLIPRPVNNLRALMQYPKINVNSKDILVSKRDSNYSFNTFWDIVNDKTKPFYTRPCSIPSLDKLFNVNLNYTIKSHAKARIRSKEAKIRLIQNISDQYKLVSKFFTVETQNSYL